MKCLNILFFLIFICFPSISTSVISGNVAPDHRIYSLYEKLDAWQCLGKHMRVIKPQSYFDLRRAMFRPRGFECKAPDWLIQETRALAPPQQVPEFQIASFVFDGDDNPILGTEAHVIPSFPLRNGRPTENGSNLYLDLGLTTSFGSDEWGVVVGLRPSWALGFRNYQDVIGKVHLREAYVKAGYRRLEASFGEMPVEFGNAKHGTLLLSQAMRPLKIFKLALRPHEPISGFGLLTWESWLSFKTDSDFLDNSRLWAFSLGWKPADWFEFGVLQLYQLGGQGIPNPNFTDLLQMLIYSGGDSLDSKRSENFSFYSSFWLPENFLKFYTQVHFKTLGSVSHWFADDVNTLLGVWFPHIGAGFNIRLEHVHTVGSAYSDPIWTQGLSYLQSPIGHPLGSDGEAFYLDVGLPHLSLWHPEFNFSYEARLENPSTGLATEFRYGVGFQLQRRWAQMALDLGVRYQHARRHRNDPNVNSDLLAFLGTFSYSGL